MPHHKQARIRLRTRLASRDLKISELAAIVGHPRTTVSKAINHGRYPRVLEKVKVALGL